MTDTSLATTRQEPKPPIVILRERLLARQAELKAALTDISPEAFIRAVMTSVSLNPEILACSWQSLWLACMRACRDGLLPDGVEGAIVPYKGVASWIPMYQGLLRRFRRSGQFRWITAGIVRANEEFAHWIDENGEHFKHIPGDSFDAPILKIYALATTKDGGIFVAVMPLDEANKIRAISKASREDAPWKMWPEEMYKKTALRRLTKYLPTSRDIISPSDDHDDAAGSAAIAEIIPAAITADAETEQQQQQRPGVGAALDQFAATEQEGSTKEEKKAGGAKQA